MPQSAPMHRAPGWRPWTGKSASPKAKQRRGTAADYDAAWRKLSKQKLAEDPLCECDDCKASGDHVAATVVDHIIPIAERPDLRLTWSNLRSMAKRHHDRHTARTVGYGRARGVGGRNL